MPKGQRFSFSLLSNLVKQSVKWCLATLLIAAPACGQTEPDTDLSKKRRAVSPLATQEPSKPTILVNSMVSGCDAGWQKRSEKPLCIDLLDGDSFKPGKPIRFKVTVGNVPEGQLLLVNLNRLSIVSLPYFIEPTEGYNGGIPLLPTPEIQPNSSFIYTWDGGQTHCYTTDTGSRCNLAKNIPAGRYVLSAELVSQTPSFDEAGFVPKTGGLQSPNTEARSIRSLTKSFAIDAPLDWSQHVRLADWAARDLAFGQLASQTSQALPSNFRNSITMMPKHDAFKQNELGRWCRAYVAGGAAKGVVELCLPPYTVSQYGLWASARDTRKFISTIDITYVNHDVGFDQSRRSADMLLAELYGKLGKVDDAPKGAIPTGPFNRSVRLDRLYYLVSEGAWLFEYDVNMKADNGERLQDDSITIAVGNHSRACIWKMVPGDRQSRSIKYRIPDLVLDKAKCARTPS